MGEPSSELKTNRLARARDSLERLCCGDAFGERFFLPDGLAHSMIHSKDVPAPPWFYTDDTMMAMSIVATLDQHGEINSDSLAKHFPIITTPLGAMVPPCINSWLKFGPDSTGDPDPAPCSGAKGHLGMALRCG